MSMEYEKGTIYITCPICGRKHSIVLTDAEVGNMHRWKNRELLIQNALPERTAYERELIRYYWSGLPMISCCEECYKENWLVDDCDE